MAGTADAAAPMQQCLYFLPLPQGHGSLRPTFNGLSRNRSSLRSMLGQRNEFVVPGNATVLLRAPLLLALLDSFARARDEVPPDDALAVGPRAADQHQRCAL